MGSVEQGDELQPRVEGVLPSDGEPEHGDDCA